MQDNESKLRLVSLIATPLGVDGAARLTWSTAVHSTLSGRAFSFWDDTNVAPLRVAHSESCSAALQLLP